MRESSITIQDVLTAGQAILASGRAVTAYSLRLQIGSGRSDRLLRLWIEHGQAQVRGTGQSPLPPRANELIDTHLKKSQTALKSVLLELSTVLAQAGRSEVFSELETLRGTVEQQQLALADAEVLVSRLEQRNEELEDLLAKSVAERLELQASVDGLKDQAQKDSSALLELTQQLGAAAEAKAAISVKYEDGQVELGKSAAEIIALRERVDGFSKNAEMKDIALLDARRDAQASREREAIVNGQLLQLQRDRDVDLQLITRLRLDLSAADAKSIQGYAEAEAYKAQLGALNDRVGAIFTSRQPGGLDE